MAQQDGEGKVQGYTRRGFLARFSLGLAALAGTGLILRGFLSGRKEGPQHADREFPGEDSIFHPRRDPRLDAAERRWKT